MGYNPKIKTIKNFIEVVSDCPNEKTLEIFEKKTSDKVLSKYCLLLIKIHQNLFVVP